MPNVDKAVRKLNEACSDAFNKQSDLYKNELIQCLIKIRDDNNANNDGYLPNFLKKVSNEGLAKFVLNLHDNLKKALKKYFKQDIVKVVEGSKSNQVGSDLVITLKDNSNFDIELKFGHETDKGIGLKTFDQMVILKDKPNYFSEKFPTITQEQHKYADLHPLDQTGLITNLKKQLSKMYFELMSIHKSGKLIINSEMVENQLNGTGSITKKIGATHPVKFEISRINVIKVKPFKDFSGKWSLKEIELSNKPDKARLTIWLTNGKSKAKFYFGWKNDYTYSKDGNRYIARTGMGSTSLNVWTYLEKK